jgi:hypothetical protein
MPPKTSESIDITPDPSMMEDIGAANYTLYQAINELLANTFDARKIKGGEKTVPVTVDVKIVPGVSVEISDNAKGMDKKTFSLALTPGYKMERHHGNSDRKGWYGLGMKTAAASLGRKWEIWTRSEDDKSDYHAVFDLEDFKTRWLKSASERWKLDLFTLDRSAASPLGDRLSGTVIRITNVRDPEPSVAVLEQHIGGAYRVEIQTFNDVILLNGTEIAVAEKSTVPDTKQEISFELKVGRETHVVKGWWARLPKYNHTGEYGFDLFRHKQLVESHIQQPFFKPHTTLSNFYGTLELPFIKADSTKKLFDKSSPEWKALAAKVSKEVMPNILKKVRTWKAKSNKQTSSGAGATTGGTIIVQTSPGGGNVLLVTEESGNGSGRKQETVSPVAAPPKPTAGLLDWKRVEFEGVPPFLLTYELVSMDSEVLPWTYLMPAEDDTLVVNVNVDSALFQKTKDTASLVMIAVADCVCQYLQEKHKKDAKVVRRLRDQWLANAAKSKFADIITQAKLS